MNPLEIQKSKRNDDENLLSLIHHKLMSTYGWISLGEFKALPIPTVMNLLEHINKDGVKEKKAYEDVRKKRK